VTGQATFYTGWAPGGGCGNILNPGPQYVGLFSTVGTSTEYYGAGELCGVCFQVTNPQVETNNPVPFPRSYTVLLNNNGPVPYPFWLDHNLANQTEIGGRWQIQYQAVPCPVNSPVQWQVQAYSQTWYFYVQPVFHSLAIAQLCINVNGWQPMQRVYGTGAWQFGGVPIPDNFQIKAISIDGQVLQDTLQVPLSVTNGVPTTTIFGGSTPGQFGPIGNLNAAIPDCNANPTIFGYLPPKFGDTVPPTDSSTKDTIPPTDSSDTTTSPNPHARAPLIGIVVAVICVVVLVVAVTLFLLKKKRSTPITVEYM